MKELSSNETVLQYVRLGSGGDFEAPVWERTVADPGSTVARRIVCEERRNKLDDGDMLRGRCRYGCFELGVLQILSSPKSGMASPEVRD
jgi:hypothetical protein